MALVLLPCDLPTWPNVQKQLTIIKSAKTSSQLIEVMQKLYTMCCISLDPDENDRNEDKLFLGLQNFLDEVMTDDERSKFFQVTLPIMTNYALQLKNNKPLDGLQYSLQQQADSTHLERKFVASLLASAFFSTFPKRTVKTHPTLQDVNFTPLFPYLNSCFQQKKLLNLFRYFERINAMETEQTEIQEQLIMLRQVMNKSTMLDMNDWLKCDVPLCPFTIKHDSQIGHSELNDIYQVCFSSSRLGGGILKGGERQEDKVFCLNPELLAVLVFSEALEDNEAFIVYSSLGSKSSALVNKTDNNELNHWCLLDALDFGSDALQQYTNNLILRELNKSYIGFVQRPSRTRLPPVGKSFSSSPSESCKTRHMPSNTICASPESSIDEKGSSDQLVSQFLLSNMFKDGFNSKSNRRIEQRPILPSRSRLELIKKDSEESIYQDCKNDAAESKPKYQRKKKMNKRSRVIKTKANQQTMGEKREGPLLLSSAKTNTKLLKVPESPVVSGLEEINSMEASFISCQSRLSSGDSVSSTSGNSGEGYVSCPEEADSTLMSGSDSISKSSQQQTLNSKHPIPPKLEDLFNVTICQLMKQESSSSSDEPCSRLTDPFGDESEMFPLKRSGSTGFILQGDEMSEEGLEVDECDLFPGEGGLEQEREWLDQFRKQRHATYTTHTDSRNSSSRYSFSSDFSSDLEEIYEHFEEKMTEGPVRENPAYASYGRYLKRTLSDSLTSSPTCRNYNAEEMGSSGKHVPISIQLRSLSLTEKMQIQERLSVECAKRMIKVGSLEAKVPPSYVNQKLSTIASEKCDNQGLAPIISDRVENAVGSSEYVISNDSISCESSVNSIDELQITLPLPRSSRMPHDYQSNKYLPTQLSVWWNYNSVYEFWVPLKGSKNVEVDLSSLIKSNDDEKPRLWGVIRRSKSSPIISHSRTKAKIASNLPTRSHSFKDAGRVGRRKPIASRSLSAVENASSFRRETSVETGDAVSFQKDNNLDSKMKLKKWQPAMDLRNEEGLSVEERRIKRPHRMETLQEENRNSLSSSDRDTVAASTSAMANFENIEKSREEVGFMTSKPLPVAVCKTMQEQQKSINKLEEFPLNDVCHSIKSIATGNWGCGHRQAGDPQLKAIIQWMAASKANAPNVIYYTLGDARLVKLNIVCRVLLDRHWTVGHVAKAVAKYIERRSQSLTKDDESDLFSSLLPKETDL